MEKETKVCVTGAAGYLGSSLTKRLLEKGCIVHATTRNLGDPKKVGLLKSLPYAGTRLKLFEADIYNPSEFQQAIEGCQYVVHMATPLEHQPHNSQFKDTSEAAVAGVKSIVESCIKLGTVKRLIYTASVVASSSLKEDGKGFKDQLDESCWTSKDVAINPYSNESLTEYACSKVASEKELLKYNNNHQIEIVSLVCGLVGGGTLLSSMPESMGLLISQATKNKMRYGTLRFLEELLGKVPILHIEDTIDAHIFCMEMPSIKGRYLCASAYLSSADIASHYRKHFPDIEIPDEFVEKLEREIVWGSNKLKEVGFEYKYDVQTTLDDSIHCGLKLDNSYLIKEFTCRNYQVMPDCAAAKEAKMVNGTIQLALQKSIGLKRILKYTQLRKRYKYSVIFSVPYSMEKETKVCVTGAASYLGSGLVQKLLEKGYIVHVTIRNLGLWRT